jgi:hypothetical protein
LGCLVIAGLGFNAYLKRQERLAQRYHLYCEVLKPGMTEEEVRKVLGQTGRFVEYGGLGDQNDHWGVIFLDTNLNNIYGGVSLNFRDFKYDMAYIEGFELESVEILCDFSQPTNSVINTPTLKP